MPGNNNDLHVCQGATFSSSTDTTCSGTTPNSEYGGHTINLDVHANGNNVKIGQETGTGNADHYAQIYYYNGDNNDTFITQKGNANKDLSTKTFSRSKKFKGMTSNNEINEKKQEEMGQVIFQAHSTKELPQILQDSNQDSNTDATTLKAGHEYNIELTPHGQKATSQFKSMDIENRLCFLSEEKPPMSNLRK